MTYSVTDVISYLSQGRPGGVEAISYVLRTCSQDMTSYGGFVWPKSGPVEAPDWDPEPKCGRGLHGLLKGEGTASHLNLSGVWQVCAVWSADVVDLVGKCKFPRAWVLLSGTKDEATFEMTRLGCTLCVYATVIGGDRATVTGGHYSRVSGGDGATVTGGDYSRVSGGSGATVTGGDHATVTGGSGATVTGGDCSRVAGGNSATVSGGDDATVSGGHYSRVAGGRYSRVTGGEGSVLSLYHYDDHGRKRIVTVYVGENGIKPNTYYRLVGGVFTED